MGSRSPAPEIGSLGEGQAADVETVVALHLSACPVLFYSTCSRMQQERRVGCRQADLECDPQP